MYAVLAFVLVGAFVVGGVSISVHDAHATHIRTSGLQPITNDTAPNKIDGHFAGKPATTVPASTVGLGDGTCWVYSNRSSWVVFKCFGGINTG